MTNKIQIYDDKNPVGYLNIFSETYLQFYYDEKWLIDSHSFAIDPELPLTNQMYESNRLWGCFEDISPDRWGRLLQNRLAGRVLNSIQYMLGVSDYYRAGSLRLKINDEFIAQTKEIPKLIHINKLMQSSLNVEKEEYLKSDLEYLIAPSSSLGGARIKASVVDNDKLYIAKFPSINDEHSVILWEKTMLDLAHIAKIKTAHSKIIETPNHKKVLLIERFDRTLDNKRIPFMSAMTLLRAKERENAEQKSYVDFALYLEDLDKQELFRRMVFNTLFGNTDDHLRNHALLFNRGAKKWNLSPAYDLNPNPLPYNKQYHALNFVDNINLPSLELCLSLKQYFAVDEKLCEEILEDCFIAASKYQEVALENGIKRAEIKYFKENFEHTEINLLYKKHQEQSQLKQNTIFFKAREKLNKINKNLENQRNKINQEDCETSVYENQKNVNEISQDENNSLNQNNENLENSYNQNSNKKLNKRK